MSCFLLFVTLIRTFFENPTTVKTRFSPPTLDVQQSIESCSTGDVLAAQIGWAAPAGPTLSNAPRTVQRGHCIGSGCT